jgi:hypothetical protein
MDVWRAAKQARPDLPDDLKIHKPYIDAITYDSPFSPGARMRRVPEVIDCWYDSGAMPFAQWGYPYANREQFEQQFPADFISEAIDQTRGWFYSLLAISTLVFDGHKLPHPYANCIVLGLMLAEWWESKHKQNGQEDFLDGGIGRRCRRCLGGAETDRQYVQVTAELAQPAGDLRHVRRRRDALVLLRQPAAVDFGDLQRTCDQGEHPGVPAAALERV